MRSRRQVEDELERCRSAVDAGNRNAEVVYETLAWVLGDNDDSPFRAHVASED